jgi:hypothetical protein
MELKTPSLKELASAISFQSSIVNEFLEKNPLPQPSFAPYGLRNWEDADGEVQAARMQLIEAATDILHLAMGPSEYIKFNALTARSHSSLGVPEIFQKKTADQVSTAKIRPIRHRSLERMECLRCRPPPGFHNLCRAGKESQYSRSTTETGSQTCNFQSCFLGSYT